MPKRAYKIHLTYWDIQNIVNMYMNGYNLAYISSVYKIPTPRISQILREMDVYHKKPTKRILVERNLNILNMFRHGKSITKIANDYGLTRQWIYVLIKKSAAQIYGNDYQLEKRQEVV